MHAKQFVRVLGEVYCIDSIYSKALLLEVHMLSLQFRDSHSKSLAQLMPFFD